MGLSERFNVDGPGVAAIGSELRSYGGISKENNSGVNMNGPKQSLLASAAAFLLGGVGYAQDEPPTVDSEANTRTIDQITVTAQKREESILDVPISIKAFDTEELDALRVLDISDYAFQVPNMTFAQENRLRGNEVSFRGISTFSGGQFEHIGVTVDEIGFGATGQWGILGSRFFDIERVEVLRGPQGTLTGRSSMGGTINIITAKPTTDELGFKLIADAGRFQTMLGKVTTNVPLSDTLAVRANVYVEQSEGSAKALFIDNTSSIDNFGGSLSFRWTPNDRLTLDLMAGGEDLRYGLDNSAMIDFDLPLERRESVRGVLENLGGDYEATDWFDLPGNGTNGSYVYNDVPQFTEIETQMYTGRVEYDVGDHTFALFGGVRDYRALQQVDQDGTEFAIILLHYDRAESSEMIEGRVTSDYEGMFNWISGVSYMYEENPSVWGRARGPWSGDLEDGTGTQPPLGTGTPNSYTPALVVDDTEEISSISGYANVFVDLTDQLNLSVGGRYSRDTTKYGGDNSDNVLVTPITDYPLIKGTTDKITWRAAATYGLTESTNVYTSVASGYRPGYPNDHISVDLVGAPENVEGEDLINYEVGVKGVLFDRRLSYALALFYMDYTEMQVGTELPNPDPDNNLGEDIGFDINAGNASSKGIEFEFSTFLTDEFEIRGGVGYNDTNISDVGDNDPGLVEQFVGKSIPGTRPLTGFADAIYTKSLTGDLTGMFRVNYQYQDERIDDPTPESGEDIIPSFSLVNLTVGVQSDNWSLTAYFENVLDEVYYHEASFSGLSATQGYRGAQVTYEPRMYGIRFTYWNGIR